MRIKKIFDENTILDLIIFGKGNNVFCASFGEEDTIKLFTRVNFQELISTEFGQDISLKTESFDQLLAIKNGKLEFVSIHSESTFIALNSTKLNHIYFLMQKIITKERKLENSLSSFISMLRQADILKSPENRKKGHFWTFFLITRSTVSFRLPTAIMKS